MLIVSPHQSAVVRAALSAPGIGGIELVNGSMSRKPSGKREARCANFNSDSVDAMIPLPSQLVYGTAIPARLPILRKNWSFGLAEDVKLQSQDAVHLRL
ncbi:hypothetical protein DS909_18315 [Phaeobacter gallaeciensis]|uniref:DNA methylase adenine-specific domain-containing protein n=2 Tax=Roseobacteraceae TaxID=2854170 RepID=A0A366WMX3_9RHOB|nr:SAM-dependent methyltransferase [Falsiruegeria litorea]MBT8166879.1 SAM-dependent methyltransferase [Falsiruegeria litorea]RBW51548.1 hypothetical protein DS909_18315 [Phaeobacter gallaeciensis]